MLLSPLTEPLPHNTRKRLGLGLCVVVLALLGISYYIESIFGNLALFFAIPLSLVAISILFGNASNGHGLLSVPTLYVLAWVILLGSIWGSFQGYIYSWAGVAFGSAVLLLARKRKQKSET